MPSAEFNYCTYTVRSIVVAVAIGGFVCSWLTCTSCKFISFNNTLGNASLNGGPPFDQAVAANVGIFSYQITRYSGGGNGVADECFEYEDRFSKLSGYPSLATAQFCAVIAPVMSGIAFFFNLFELCACNFPGSFAITSLLFLTAAGIQAGTFTLVADPEFCFEHEEMECDAGKGVTLSAIATVLYFICSCLICCSPRADPFCWNFGQDPDAERKRRQASAPKQPAVIVQPIIIETGAPSSPKKSRGKVNSGY